MLHDLFPKPTSVAFHYRGYPPSEGRPGAAALQRGRAPHPRFRSARLRPGAHDRRRVQRRQRRRRALAGRAPARRADPGDAVRFARPRWPRDHYRWLPVRLLFRHAHGAGARLRRRPTPVAIVAGGRDRPGPRPAHAGPAAAAPILAYDRTIEDAGTTTVTRPSRVRATMREALERVLRGSGFLEHVADALRSPRI